MNVWPVCDDAVVKLLTSSEPADVPSPTVYVTGMLPSPNPDQAASKEEVDNWKSVSSDLCNEQVVSAP